MAKFQPLSEWIEEAIGLEDGRPKCTRLACMYVRASGAEVSVKSRDIGDKPPPAKELATLFERSACAHGQELEGIQTYRMLAFYGGDEPDGAGHPFHVLNGQLRNGGLHAPPERADATGLVQQTMRHLENTQKMLADLIGKHMEDRQAMQTEITACYGIIQKSMIERVNLEFNRQKELAEFQRATEERKAIMALLPVLLNTLSGAEVIPNTTADTALIEGLARAVPLESVQMMVQSGMIPAKLVAPLMTRMKQVLEQDKKTSEALAKVPPANTNPLQDVQGN